MVTETCVLTQITKPVRNSDISNALWWVVHKEIRASGMTKSDINTACPCILHFTTPGRRRSCCAQAGAAEWQSHVMNSAPDKHCAKKEPKKTWLEGRGLKGGPKIFRPGNDAKNLLRRPFPCILNIHAVRILCILSGVESISWYHTSHLPYDSAATTDSWRQKFALPDTTWYCVWRWRYDLFFQP